MSKHTQESHIRSLLKGLSWRIIATTDTILVVLLVTCLSGDCSINQAVTIGAIEFLIKYVVYYVHERLWQSRFVKAIVVQKELLWKTISWRCVATAMTFIISGSILDAFDEIALYIALTELFTKFVLYYLHICV